MSEDKTKSNDKTADASAPATAPASGVDMTKVKVIKNVTLPILKREDNVPIWVRITAPIHTGKQLKGTGEKAKMEPARLVDLVDLTTGEIMQMICNTVLESSLTEAYENDSYVGKCFLIEQQSPEGKRYKTFKILETEDPAKA